MKSLLKVIAIWMRCSYFATSKNERLKRNIGNEIKKWHFKTPYINILFIYRYKVPFLKKNIISVPT
jgi:hypothetical protein